MLDEGAMNRTTLSVPASFTNSEEVSAAVTWGDGASWAHLNTPNCNSVDKKQSKEEAWEPENTS